MQSSIHPFVLGVVSTLSALWVVQQIGRRQQSSSSSSSQSSTTREKRGGALFDDPELDQRIIRKAEAIIQNRTSRITVVIERCTDDHNYSAILRSAEALGLQNIWLIDPPAVPGVTQDGTEDEVPLVARTSASGNRMPVKAATGEEKRQRALHHLYAKQAQEHLTIREFTSTTECLTELRRTGHTVWVTDLGQEAVCLTPEGLSHGRLSSSEPYFPLPTKVAIVMGTEAVGCSGEMLQAADERVYFPLRGFADSLNLSVATALVLHQLFVLDPSIVGDMTEEERRDLRQQWFPKLCRQRLLSKAQKKRRGKLQQYVENCKRTQEKHDRGEHLNPDELEKLKRCGEFQKELEELELSTQYRAKEGEEDPVAKAVQDLVDNPPSPLTDLRRCDPHRVTFAGKNTKKFYKDLWKDIAATTSYNTRDRTHMVSSNFFRERVQQVVSSVSGVVMKSGD